MIVPSIWHYTYTTSSLAIYIFKYESDFPIQNRKLDIVNGLLKSTHVLLLLHTKWRWQVKLLFFCILCLKRNLKLVPLELGENEQRSSLLYTRTTIAERSIKSNSRLAMSTYYEHYIRLYIRKERRNLLKMKNGFSD